MSKSNQFSPYSSTYFLNEAIRQQSAIDTIRHLYKSWGYTMVRTPMVDSFDTHSHLFSPSEEDRIYRLIGRDGSVLMLRSDITIFLLKYYKNLLRNAKLPLRIAYSDNILRHENGLARDEQYQTGAELIGLPENAKDYEQEILLLLCENLSSLGLKAPALHIGSRKIFDIVFSHILSKWPDSFLPDDDVILRKYIILRSWEDLQNHFTWDVNLTEEIINFFSCIRNIQTKTSEPIPPTNNIKFTFYQQKDRGETEQMDFSMYQWQSPHFQDPLYKQELQSEIDYLHSLAMLVKRHFPDVLVRIDFSEIGPWHYYSGLAFQVYLPGISSAIISGGRYDRLLAEMNLEGVATGYSLMLSALNLEDKDTESPRMFCMEYPHSSLEERYLRAKEVRNTGESVCL